MSSFTITTAVNIDTLVKLGSVASIAWTRSTTTATITQNSHGLASNDRINVTVTSDAAAITTGLKTITVVNANSYTFTCLNAGAASGTITASHLDDYLINGGYLTVDQDTRYGTNQNTSAAIGDITLSATLGGTIEINSTLVRLIPYDTGTGNVPPYDTVISKGSASGKMIGVYSAINVAPTTPGSAMPASGYIKIRQWNSVAYTSGALTGISASATGADVEGWLEIVGSDSSTITANRLNLFKVRGDYFKFFGVTTSGSRATTYQLPTNGMLRYCPGVEVETEVGSGVYEFYPTAGSRTALIANINTDAVRGKWCWIGTDGLVRFGHDGTNSTGGYLPVSGLNIRVPNIFFETCLQTTLTVNALPNATLATRMEFLTSGGGVIDIDKCCMNWYMNFLQAFSVSLTNVSTFESMLLAECASPIAWSNVGVGQTGTANTQIALIMSLNFAGGTMSNCVFSRIAQATSGTYVTSWADCTGFTVTDCKFISLLKAANATSGSSTMTRVVNCTFTNTVLGGGRVFMVGCNTVTFTNTVYYDNIATTTGTALPMYVWDLGTAASFTLKFDGLTFGGLTLVQPYSGILNIGIAGCSDIKLRNLGTAASPLDMGGAYVDATWTRSTTTMTVTKVAHGLKTGDIIAVNMCSDVAPKAVTTTTGTLWTLASAPTADTFTVTVTNAGQTTGQNLSYYPCMAAVLVNFTSGSAATNVKIQRCYTPHLRTGLFSGLDNSIKGLLVENAWGSEWGVQLVPSLNAKLKNIQSTPALTAQTSCYGTHFIDFITTNIPANIAAVSWSRSTTTATVTSTAHGLRVGNQILVTVTSDAASIVLGVKTITQITATGTPVNTANTFQFTCLNAGGASGTLTFVPLNGRVAIQMNESTADTSSLITLANGAAFTSAGGLFMPTIGHQAEFETDYYIINHLNFPITEAVMAGGTIGQYDSYYSINTGAGFSAYKNLYYNRDGGGGSNASTNVTMTDTTGVAVGDYVFGTNIAPLAKVSSITNGTTIVVSIANIGTVSGTLRFNQLPNEANLASTGAKFKVKIVTRTTNTNAITSLYWFAYNTTTTRAYTYSLDPVTVRITVKDINTGLPIENARVFLETDPGGVDIFNTLTDVNGVVENIEYPYTANTNIVGRVRKASGTFYKTASIIGEITSSGYSTTVYLIPDQ